MKNTLLCAVLLAFTVLACKKEQRFSRFSTNILAPILHTSLDLDNLVSDSVLVPDANGALRLITEYDLYRGRIADFFTIPDTQRMNTLSLKTLKLSDQQQTQAVPLFLVYPAATAAHGQTTTIPAQSVANLSSIPIDASSFFQEATFQSGTMEISIDNGYPVELTRIIFELKNTSNGVVIQTDTFTNIAPGATQTKVIDLAGKTLSGQMTATALLVETAASSGPVLVNQYDLTIIRIAVKDMKPVSAIARFPAQSVISEEQTVVYYFGKAELKKLKVKGGRVSFNIVSTIQEDMKVDYRIPYATLNGVPFHQTFTVPAAPTGGSSNFVTNYDISGYEIDLRGKDPLIRDTVNSFYNVLDVSIDSSGFQRSISLNDSIFLYLGLLDLEPEYAEGYFGQEKIELGPETIDLDLMSGITGGLDFEDLNFTIGLQNGIGAEASAKFHWLTSRNTTKGTALSLNGPITSVHMLPPATYAPLVPSYTYINLNPGNSNIKPFIEMLPDKLDYFVEIRTNPNGNTTGYKDFVTDESELVATLGVDVPVSLKADNITLMDTLDFDFSTLQNSGSIMEGSLNIVADNGFPFEVGIQVFLLDQYGIVIDSLVLGQNDRIQPAPTDGNNRVAAPLRSVVVARVDAAKMPKLRAAKKVAFRAVLNTPKTNANYWKIYSNYTLNLSLTADFVYDQNY